MRPEQGLLALRRELGVYANLRPARGGRDRHAHRPRAHRWSLLRRQGHARRRHLVRHVRVHAARGGADRPTRRSRSPARRGGRLTSVDKVNVMHTSRLWRDVVTELGAGEYPDVPLDHALVDSFAMTIVNAPETIDVVVTENTFGDILSDVAAAVTGGLGLAGVGVARRRRPRDLRAGARLGAADRRSGDRQPGGDAALGGAAAAPRSRAGRRRGRARGRASTRRSSRRRLPTSAARPTTQDARRRRVARARPLPYPLTTMESAPTHVHRVLAFRLRLSALVGASVPAPRRLADIPGGSSVSTERHR